MIETFLQKGLRNPLCFDTLKELEEYVDSTLNVNDVVTLLGVVAVGDGLGHQRIIKEADDGTGVILKNGLYANIIANSKLSDKANKAVQIVAGMGIKGGGTLGDSAINLSVESANDGLVVNSDSLELATVNNLKDSSTTKPLSAAMGQKLGDEKVNFTDIVNDFITGGTNKVASAETVKILKQIIDTMGEGGVAKLAAQLKSAEKSRIPSTGTLPAGGSVMVASSGLVIDPRVYINGELVAPSGYTIDYNAAAITLTEPVKYSAVFFIDDTYAPKFKFSVSTVNFLVNAPTLKEKLALGDVIDIQGESDAYDGGHHVRVVESTSKLNGVDLGGGLFLNEVPNSRISNKQDMFSSELTTESKEIVGGINENKSSCDFLKRKIFFDRIDSSTHLDRLIGVGSSDSVTYYGMPSATVIGSDKGYPPTSKCGIVEVVKTFNTHIIQRYHEVDNNNGIYVRSGGRVTDGQITWSTWSRVYETLMSAKVISSTDYIISSKLNNFYAVKLGNIMQFSFAIPPNTTISANEVLVTFSTGIFKSVTQVRLYGHSSDVLLYIGPNERTIRAGRSTDQTTTMYTVICATIISSE